jgi:predicted nucleotidyltransferase
VISLVEDRIREVRQICCRHAVERLGLFGSTAGEGFDDHGDSDLDFVVSFERRDPPELLDRFFGLKEDLEGLFGQGVDLVMEGAVGRNPYFAESPRPGGSGTNPRRIEGLIPLAALQQIQEAVQIHPSLLQDVGEGRAFYRPMRGNRYLQHLVAHPLLQPDVAATLSHDHPTTPLQRTNDPVVLEAGDFQAHNTSSCTRTPSPAIQSSSTGSR